MEGLIIFDLNKICMIKSKVEDPERQNWIKESIKIVGQSKNTKEEELFPGLSVTIIYVSVIILNSPIKRYSVRLSSLKKKKKRLRVWKRHWWCSFWIFSNSFIWLDQKTQIAKHKPMDNIYKIPRWQAPLMNYKLWSGKVKVLTTGMANTDTFE